MLSLGENLGETVNALGSFLRLENDEIKSRGGNFLLVFLEKLNRYDYNYAYDINCSYSRDCWTLKVRQWNAVILLSKHICKVLKNPEVLSLDGLGRLVDNYGVHHDIRLLTGLLKDGLVCIIKGSADDALVNVQNYVEYYIEYPAPAGLCI